MITDSMRRAMEETERRRRLQIEFNAEHDITPETIRKGIRAGIEAEIRGGDGARMMVGEDVTGYAAHQSLKELEEEMQSAADRLDFEYAAALRDRILAIQQQSGLAGGMREDSWQPRKSRGKKKRRSFL
jgi:excinuclease ABC subunit B